MSGVDDSLELLLLCCHPALSRPSQVAMTLRAVGGLTTPEIARAFLVPEATIAQRISRAKATIARAGARFELPADAELGARVGTVAAVVYLIFTEGHTASSGAAVGRTELTREAIRLTRLLHARAGLDSRLAAYRGELAGLLALMLLTDARANSRVGEGGTLIPLAEQDRSAWDRALIDEGAALVTAALRDCPLGPYQLQAAIAAVHAEAPSTEQTDWPQILALYDLLVAFAPGPMISLNRIVAVAMVHGERAALRELTDGCTATPALAAHHRSHAVRAHLLERLGRAAPPRPSTAPRPGSPSACPSSATSSPVPRLSPARTPLLVFRRTSATGVRCDGLWWATRTGYEQSTARWRRHRARSGSAPAALIGGRPALLRVPSGEPVLGLRVERLCQGDTRAEGTPVLAGGLVEPVDSGHRRRHRLHPPFRVRCGHRVPPHRAAGQVARRTSVPVLRPAEQRLVGQCGHHLGGARRPAPVST